MQYILLYIITYFESIRYLSYESCRRLVLRQTKAVGSKVKTGLFEVLIGPFLGDFRSVSSLLCNRYSGFNFSANLKSFHGFIK